MSMKTLSTLAIGLAALSLAIAGCAGNTTTGGGGTGGSTSPPTTGGAGGTGGEGTGGMLPPGTCTKLEDCPPVMNDPCNTAGCLNGVCSKLPANEGAACEDGLFCTANDTCKNGVCTAGG